MWQVTVEEKFGIDDSIDSSYYFKTKQEADEFIESLNEGNYGIWLCKGTPLEDDPEEVEFRTADAICIRSLMWNNYYDDYYDEPDERLAIERDLDAEFDAMHLY